MGPADLTIVVNSGVHRLAEEHLREEVFVASEGSLDLSSPEAIHTEFRQILLRIARKLKSHAWNRVYIIPFGGECTDGEPTSLRLRLRCRVIPKAFESTHDFSAARRVDRLRKNGDQIVVYTGFHATRLDVIVPLVSRRC
jgi:hypothetical protein